MCHRGLYAAHLERSYRRMHGVCQQFSSPHPPASFGYLHPQWPSTDDPIEPMVTTLNERLRQLRLSLYAQERTLADVRREKLWGFPEEMRALQIPLRAFLR